MDLQLLFVLAFVAMSIFDAMGRRRKKQERMEEMEREEREEWVQGTGSSAERGEAQTTRGGRPTPREVDPRGGVEEWEWEGSGSGPKGEGTPASKRSPSPQTPRNDSRETADSMIPDDLWGILTGQVPPTRQEPPAPPPQPRGPVPPPAGSSRSAPSPMRKPEPPRPPRPGPAGRGPVMMPPAPKPPQKKTVLDPTEVPWRDIAVGEIGSEGGTLVTPLRRGEIGAPASVTRVGRGRSPYLEDLRSGGREGLRKAIVLQEVLGPPVSLRPAELRVWEAWEE